MLHCSSKSSSCDVFRATTLTSMALNNAFIVLRQKKGFTNSQILILTFSKGPVVARADSSEH